MSRDAESPADQTGGSTTHPEGDSRAEKGAVPQQQSAVAGVVVSTAVEVPEAVSASQQPATAVVSNNRCAFQGDAQSITTTLANLAIYLVLPSAVLGCVAMAAVLLYVLVRVPSPWVVLFIIWWAACNLCLTFAALKMRRCKAAAGMHPVVLQQTLSSAGRRAVWSLIFSILATIATIVCTFVPYHTAVSQMVFANDNFGTVSRSRQLDSVGIQGVKSYDRSEGNIELDTDSLDDRYVYVGDMIFNWRDVVFSFYMYHTLAPAVYVFLTLEFAASVTVFYITRTAASKLQGLLPGWPQPHVTVVGAGNHHVHSQMQLSSSPWPGRVGPAAGQHGGWYFAGGGRDGHVGYAQHGVGGAAAVPVVGLPLDHAVHGVHAGIAAGPVCTGPVSACQGGGGWMSPSASAGHGGGGWMSHSASTSHGGGGCSDAGAGMHGGGGWMSHNASAGHGGGGCDAGAGMGSSSGGGMSSSVGMGMSSGGC